MPRLPKLPPPGPRGRKFDLAAPQVAEAVARFVEHRMTRNDTSVAGTVLRRFFDENPDLMERFIDWYEDK
jgi:hypothetical protein